MASAPTTADQAGCTPSSHASMQHGAADACLLLALCACAQLVGELVPASPAIVLQVDAVLPLLCGWAVAVAGAGALEAGTQHAAAHAQAGAGSRWQWEQHHPARAATGSAAGPHMEVQVAALSALLRMTSSGWVELLRCGHLIERPLKRVS